jgi:hypothetical protein
MWKALEETSVYACRKVSKEGKSEVAVEDKSGEV